MMKFDRPLIEGTILSRPNRFIMMVDRGGRAEKCHCPSTGRIGNISFDNVPCLLSEHASKERKTRYTVEAISIDGMKSWIGINQNRANDYIAFFLERGMLGKIAKKGKIEREKKLGNSRIDFVAGGKYIEVKTPLIEMPPNDLPKLKHENNFNSFGRLIRHFHDLSAGKAVLLLCYMYDAPPFRPPQPDKSNREIMAAAKSATKKGLEHWQVNLRINKKGVELIRYFRLKPFK